MALDTPDMIGDVPAVAVWGDRITRRRQYFALYAPDGTAYPHSGFHAAHYRSAPQRQPDLSDVTGYLDGPVLFAGLAPRPFGQVLLNSIGRLWALDRLPPETRLLFVTDGWALPKNYPFLRNVLRLFGVTNEIVVSRESIRLDRAHLAEDRFGEALEGRGTPAFYDWVDRKLPPKGAVDPDRAVYVTRSRLGPDVGRYACETHLERLLAAQGYRIFAPERHDLATQAEVYQRAGRLIFAEGAALHLYGLLARPGQTVAAIRRQNVFSPLVAAQMADRGETGFAAIDAVREMLWPPKPGDHHALSVLNFPKLQRKLRILD